MVFQTDTEALTAADSKGSHTAPNAWLLVVCFSVLHVLVAWLRDGYLIGKGLLGIPGSEGEGVPGIGSLTVQQQQVIRWVGYALMPLAVIVRAGFTAISLSIGAAFASWKMRFSDLFRIAVRAEVVWAVAAVIHLVWMVLFLDLQSKHDYTLFYPLSMLNVVRVSGEATWAAYLLKTLNLFELAYVAMLVAIMRPMLDRPGWKVAILVVASYGGALALLVAGVTFFLLSVA